MQALAIVMDYFSDVELLCDLLEACRKRNVSVHLLLDHLNLNLFIGMWQDLKLNGKNFPVSVFGLYPGAFFLFFCFSKHVQTNVFGWWGMCEVQFFFAVQARRHILTGGLPFVPGAE